MHRGPGSGGYTFAPAQPPYALVTSPTPVPSTTGKAVSCLQCATNAGCGGGGVCSPAGLCE